MFMYFYCYVCCALYILFSSCQLTFCGYPDCGLSVLFPQLQGKCQGTPRKQGARSALFLISELCCSVYSFVSIVFFYVLFVCKCVLLPPSVNPIAVKYITSYHNSSGRIMVLGSTQPLTEIKFRYTLSCSYIKLSDVGNMTRPGK
jgi:hypothetical protein